MKRFTTRIILLSIPILLLFTGIELALRYIPNDYKYKKEYLDNNSNDIETLILGNSHAYFGISPVYFTDKTFNAGYVSQSLDYDFEILSKYLNDLKSLKTVVLSISYPTLYTSLRLGSESWRVKNYVIYYEMNISNRISDFSELLSLKLRDNFHNLIEYYIKRNIPIYCDELGWGTSYNSKDALSLTKTGKSAAIRQSIDIRQEVIQQEFKNNIAILNSIIEFCNDKNARLILITLPAFKAYRENLNGEQLNTTIRTVSELASNYNNCDYYNLISDSNFVEKDFYDADHLSEIGAKKLSELISSKIDETQN